MNKGTVLNEDAVEDAKVDLSWSKNIFMETLQQQNVSL